MFQCLVLIVAYTVVSMGTGFAVNTTSRQAIVYDMTTDTLLYEKNADERVPTSSMSKAITLYVVFEDLENGRIDLDDKVLISEKAYKMGGSRMFLEPNSKVRVEDLIRGVAVQSGNDAAVALAELISFDEDTFAQRLNLTAAKLGMTNSHFINASGWPASNHYSTVRDLAVLAVAIKRDFPDYYHYFGERSFRHNRITQYNRNPLLKFFNGSDGLKTGHTEAAGYGLIGTASLRERDIVVVVNGAETKKERRLESLRLMEWAYTNFKISTVAFGGDPLTHSEVWYGDADKVYLAPPEDIQLSTSVRRAPRLEAKAVVHEPLLAPISKGEQLGELIISIDGHELRRVPLVAVGDVAPANAFDRAMFTAYRLFANLFNASSETQ